MDWEQFFLGIGMIVTAFLFRKLDLWAYGKDGEEWSDYNYLKKAKGKIFNALLIIGGLIVILVSFSSKG